jgi:hypothetical protein
MAWRDTKPLRHPVEIPNHRPLLRNELRRHEQLGSEDVRLPLASPLRRPLRVRVDLGAEGVGVIHNLAIPIAEMQQQVTELVGDGEPLPIRRVVGVNVSLGCATAPGEEPLDALLAELRVYTLAPNAFASFTGSTTVLSTRWFRNTRRAASSTSCFVMRCPCPPATMPA